jgi:hypothetical protein
MSDLNRHKDRAHNRDKEFECSELDCRKTFFDKKLLASHIINVHTKKIDRGMFVCLSVCLSVYLYVCLSVCLKRSLHFCPHQED